jgi:uncharacterized membrane protein YkgB
MRNPREWVQDQLNPPEGTDLRRRNARLVALTIGAVLTIALLPVLAVYLGALLGLFAGVLVAVFDAIV